MRSIAEIHRDAMVEHLLGINSDYDSSSSSSSDENDHAEEDLGSAFVSGSSCNPSQIFGDGADASVLDMAMDASRLSERELAFFGTDGRTADDSDDGDDARMGYPRETPYSDSGPLEMRRRRIAHRETVYENPAFSQPQSTRTLAPGSCDKCDGAHRSENCPYFPLARAIE